jgi:hypothetical protein
MRVPKRKVAASELREAEITPLQELVGHVRGLEAEHAAARRQQDVAEHRHAK